METDPLEKARAKEIQAAQRKVEAYERAIADKEAKAIAKEPRQQKRQKQKGNEH